VRKLNIFTDVRPLFDETGTKVHFSIVTNTLYVRFMSNDEPATMYFSLDSGDLDDLESQIAKAKRKNGTVNHLYKGIGVPILAVEDQDRPIESSEGREP
jgi:hypothetical protein